MHPHNCGSLMEAWLNDASTWIDDFGDEYDSIDHPFCNPPSVTQRSFSASHHSHAVILTLFFSSLRNAIQRTKRHSFREWFNTIDTLKTFETLSVGSPDRKPSHTVNLKSIKCFESPATSNCIIGSSINRSSTTALSENSVNKIRSSAPPIASRVPPLSQPAFPAPSSGRLSVFDRQPTSVVGGFICYVPPTRRSRSGSRPSTARSRAGSLGTNTTADMASPSPEPSNQVNYQPFSSRVMQQLAMPNSSVALPNETFVPGLVQPSVGGIGFVSNLEEKRSSWFDDRGMNGGGLIITPRSIGTVGWNEQHQVNQILNPQLHNSSSSALSGGNHRILGRPKENHHAISTAPGNYITGQRGLTSSSLRHSFNNDNILLHNKNIELNSNWSENENRRLSLGIDPYGI